MLGKDERVRGTSFPIKTLLKGAGPSWKGRQVRPEGTQRMEKEQVWVCVCAGFQIPGCSC